MGEISTSLSVSLGIEDKGNEGLALELDRIEPLVGNPAGKAIIRQYPPVDAELYVSRGTVEALGVVREYLEAEVVTFNQSTTASTSKIMDAEVEIVKNWAFDVSTGREVRTVRFTPTLGGTEITASQPITGGVIVTYRSSYRELEYVFDVEIVDKTIGLVPIGDIIMYTGTLVAYYEGDTATLTLRPPRLSDPAASEATEIYKVTSKVVVNDRGVWERPTDWPDKNLYEGYPGKVGPEIGDPYIENERVHEVGLVDEYGRFTLQTRFTPARQPFTMNTSFDTPYEFSSSYSAENIRDPTCAVNYGSIINRLKKVYGFSDSDIVRFGCS